MLRNLSRASGSLFALRTLAVSSVLALTGAIHTGHEVLWSLFLFFSLTLLRAMSGRKATAVDVLRPDNDAGQTLNRRGVPVGIPTTKTGLDIIRVPITSYQLSKNLSSMQNHAEITMQESPVKNPVVLTAEDYNRLKHLVAGASPDNEMSLAHELQRAIIVRNDALPPHTIGIGSRVTVQELETQRVMAFHIVMPPDADMRKEKVSILTPLGTALIGFRAGEEVTWKMPAGIRRYKILEVAAAA